MLVIKNANISDIPLIWELTFKIWPQTYAPILSQEQIAYMLEMMYSAMSLQKQFNSNANFILCFYNDEPVGFASWSEIEPNVFKLHKIYVLPTRQGGGIGKYMIDHILTVIKNTGALALELNVNRYNPAKSFYEKLGFKIIRDEDIDIGNGYFMNDHVMRYYL